MRRAKFLHVTQTGRMMTPVACNRLGLQNVMSGATITKLHKEIYSKTVEMNKSGGQMPFLTVQRTFHY